MDLILLHQTLINMKPNNLHHFHLLLILLTNSICFIAIQCQETQSIYDVCAVPIRSGDFLLGYPFSGLGRPAYCGHSGFEISVGNSFNYKSVDYQIIGMNISTHTITMARYDLFNDRNICPQAQHNTSYNSMIFDVDTLDNEEASLYYGCNVMESSPWNQFVCDVNDTVTFGYFIRSSRIDSDLPDCQNHMIVRVKTYLADVLITPNSGQDGLISLLNAGFDLKWKANNNDCDQCSRSGGWCGSNDIRPELFACYCSTGNFSLTCNDMDVNKVVHHGGGHEFNIKLKLVIGFLSIITGSMSVCFVTLCWKKRLWETRFKTTNHQLEMFIQDYGTLAPKRYKFSELKKMTNSFREELGRGGYGSVYKGVSPDGQLIAVKLLVRAKGDGEDFINEVASISRTSHVNIVTLLGFCIEGKNRALIYEFMPNGSLDKFLRDDGSRLDWNTLFLIAKGIARGLEYLHRGCNTRIVHFDIKPHNILLDAEFVPKISDFGLAKLCKWKESIVSVMGARGTAGYMAPEVFLRSLGGASHKSDVYSYGMMVFEMTGARENNNFCCTSSSEAQFPESIYKKVEAGDNLGVYGVANEYEEEMARKMVTVSLWCIQSGPSDRPSISKVVEMLEGSLESLQVPPSRFWPVSPTTSSLDTSSLTNQSSTDKRLLLTVQSS